MSLARVCDECGLSENAWCDCGACDCETCTCPDEEWDLGDLAYEGYDGSGW